MKIVTTVEELRRERSALPGTAALVPTMGALHDGHLSLMARGKKEADHLIVSIFVNPTQFGPGEDFEKYPRKAEEDAELCRQVGADIIFMPEVSEIYPEEPSVTMKVGKIASGLCGEKRPGHFDGVVQVVSILFNMVQPDIAVFGEKDYQQLLVIRKLVSNYHFPVKIIPGKTVRESDGLAKSSRNRYLSEEERSKAPAINRTLQEIRRLCIEAEERNEELSVKDLEVKASKMIMDAIPEARIDYLKILNEENLEAEPETGKLSHIFAAVFIGTTRLIDNLHLGK